MRVRVRVRVKVRVRANPNPNPNPNRNPNPNPNPNLAQVDAVGLQQVEDARVAQPVVALGGVRELVEHDELEVGVLGEVLDHVVAWG